MHDHETPSEAPAPAAPVHNHAARETAEQATERAQQCAAEIDGVLRKHGCRVVTQARHDRVGDGPFARLLIETSWGVQPLPR